MNEKFKNFMLALGVLAIWVAAIALLGPIGILVGLAVCYFVFKDK